MGKCIDDLENCHILSFFLYFLYIFVWLFNEHNFSVFQKLRFFFLILKTWMWQIVMKNLIWLPLSFLFYFQHQDTPSPTPDPEKEKKKNKFAGLLKFWDGMQKIICGHEKHPKKAEGSETKKAKGTGDHHRSKRSADSMTEGLSESFDFGRII